MDKATEKLRNKADKLLQEYNRLMNDKCLVCRQPCQVGHHFVTKASSNALRYYLPNIIPLCNKCHCLVHRQPHLVEPVICFKKGEEWYRDLMGEKKTTIKANKAWYQGHIETLHKLLLEAK